MKFNEIVSRVSGFAFDAALFCAIHYSKNELTIVYTIYHD
jgi:hypothetical protein